MKVFNFYFKKFEPRLSKVWSQHFISGWQTTLWAATNKQMGIISNWKCRSLIQSHSGLRARFCAQARAWAASRLAGIKTGLEKKEGTKMTGRIFFSSWKSAAAVVAASPGIRNDARHDVRRFRRQLETNFLIPRKKETHWTRVKSFFYLSGSIFKSFCVFSLKC